MEPFSMEELIPPPPPSIPRCASGILLLLAALSLSGCSSVEPIRFADGDRGYRASCPGFGDNYSRCYEQAAAACGSAGYDLTTRDGATRYHELLRQGYSSQGAEYRQLYGSVHFRSIYLRCRAASLVGKL